ncbi:hypothetical protein Hypma_007925 [Hypsizygus marmoreus]|uniref:Uncharacterized protein n=1 Tax=Hypsizygus marmoreus TaxID=39966 RepID=A0A369K014_HYPMA|nr:hypothetical protein Hypma_007925 [Hypsizygus marmoreus]
MQTVLSLLHGFLNPFTCSFSTPSPTPRQIMRPLPDLPLEIWLEIFQFATYVQQHATIVPLDPFTPKRVSNNVMGINTPSLSTRTKLSLVLVCRSWRAVAVQMLYDYVVIRSPARANALLAVLLNSAQISSTNRHTPSYGQWTRHIEIYTHARGADELRFLQTLFRIFQLCPKLRMLSGTWIHSLPTEFLDAISKLYGPSLQGMYWNDRSITMLPPSTTLEHAPNFLGSFKSLRVLDLRGYWGHTFSILKSSPPMLPRLQDLILSTSPRSLQAATALVLPSLRNLTLKTSVAGTEDMLVQFLKVHGSSLTSIDLPSPAADSDPEPDTSQLRRTAFHLNPDIFLQDDLCPNLETLTFPTTSPPLSPDIKHPLRRIGLRGVRADGLYPDKETGTKVHLMSFTSSHYPNLEVIRTIGFLVEADTDSLIKDIFIWWVEKFEKQGVDFLDGEGVLWAYSDDEACRAEDATIFCPGRAAEEKKVEY